MYSPVFLGKCFSSLTSEGSIKTKERLLIFEGLFLENLNTWPQTLVVKLQYASVLYDSVLLHLCCVLCLSVHGPRCAHPSGKRTKDQEEQKIKCMTRIGSSTCHPRNYKTPLTERTQVKRGTSTLRDAVLGKEVHNLTTNFPQNVRADPPLD